jgi:fused signal recognition particle receptor
MFSHITSLWNKIVGTVSRSFQALCGRNTIDEDTLAELHQLCIQADMGPAVSNVIIAWVRDAAQSQKTVDVRLVLKDALLSLLATSKSYEHATASPIVMLVGINGSGKTTTAAKLAARAQVEGKKVLLVAADTFRAAAVEQLQMWAVRLGITCIAGTPQQDPAAVIFAACSAWKTGSYDYMIIDTAGRLQTKLHLMEELGKMRRVMSKQLPKISVTTLLTVDSMLGQNSFEQARIFNEAVRVDGIVLTKCDGTGKGGIIFQISQEFKIPIAYVTVGEGITDIAAFRADQFVDQLINGPIS